MRCCLMLCCLTAACSDTQVAEVPPVEGMPTAVRIDNHTDAAIYVGGNGLPFLVANASERFAPHPRLLCSDCDAVCNTTYHGDPAAMYLELPSGQSFTTQWEGRLYLQKPKGCRCSDSAPFLCSEPMRFKQGSYVFEVPFADELAEHYKKHGNLVDGLTAWNGGIGYATFEQVESFYVDYTGQEEIVLTFQSLP